MPFANIKLPQTALSKAQKEDLIHRTTQMFVDFFGEGVRPYTMVLVEEVADGGYGRADEVFIVPEVFRAKE
ncbi:tautomerase family protein [Mesorhizobium sp. CO1-1-8]|uniref:tautomerase family protein n=1 Tax=Mesorhizobium sp. CO1-1-8 TaxID=2876631 RepID=UPI001CD04BB9|nr:4-oxalocrotonate tautomerase family protein [Mesorhizobium sp. CO1-1-8]MBZ9775396.1 4-oxalocrotonate tautomerase family protein [Mesorhizobium sp. CO1-1-8]